jgi:phosphoglycerate dehydrogenase-like enzyme
MIKVLFHYEAGPKLLVKLDALKDQNIDITCCDQSDDEKFEAFLQETDVLWHVLRPITPDHIAQAPSLKLIQKIGVGVNTIDLGGSKSARRSCL